MIRFRRLQPDTVRGIRHWAIELAVVVVGVLLALWAAEWANDRGEKRKDAQAIEALRTELVDNLTSIGLWQAMDQCQSDQIVYLRDLLANEGREWPGIDRELLTTDIRVDLHAMVRAPDLPRLGGGRRFRGLQPARSR